MNKTRLQTLKKKRKWLLMTKLVSIFYLLAISFIYLTSGSATEAHYNFVTSDSFEFQAGTWWDGSHLVFLEDEEEENVVKGCEAVKVKIPVQNDSEYGMMGSTEYEVHQTNHKNDAQIVTSGTIPALDAKEKEVITFTADKPGNYQVKVYQREGYEDNYETRTETWSKTIKVVCEEDDELKPDESTPEEKGQPGSADENQTDTEEKESTDSDRSSNEQASDDTEEVSQEEEQSQDTDMSEENKATEDETEGPSETEDDESENVEETETQSSEEQNPDEDEDSRDSTK
ncbi:YqxM protein [Salinibacillus kushneri]|uniref:YqxM protein n=1 Tax=Salinibacillus kushneri TaxID=237682 RepID=A0A1I0JH65_9BACI|nr:amyloid fiber anchoring/assembly protein TapA [Salinibacillus kushneri]SEU09554.1 YqxM protein [Salinibacillus kushneri]